MDNTLEKPAISATRLDQALVLGQPQQNGDISYVNGAYYRTREHQGIALAYREGVSTTDALGLLILDLFTHSIHDYRKPRLITSFAEPTAPGDLADITYEREDNVQKVRLLRRLYHFLSEHPQSVAGFTFGDNEQNAPYSIMATFDADGADLRLNSITKEKHLRPFILARIVQSQLTIVTPEGQAVLEQRLV